MIMEMTGEQKRAVEHFGSDVIVSAGAGTGKTRVLVARYCEILRRGLAGIEEIVAITFTRKAAREMKDRIREHLAGEDLHQGPLQDLETAPISTIHSFCGRILKENALPAGIDPDFRLLEEVEAVIFRESEIREATVEAIHQGREGIIKLLSRFDLDTLTGLFRNIYANRGAMEDWISLSSENSGKRLAGWDPSDYIETRLGAVRVDPVIRESIDILATRKALDEGDKIEKTRRSVLAWAGSLLEGCSVERARSMLGEFGGIHLGGGRQASWRGDDLAEVKDAIGQIRERLKGVREDLEPLPEEEEKEIGEVLGLIMREYAQVERRLVERKRAASLLDYDDLLIQTKRVLRSNPGLARHLGRKYRYFLVDEFQDTDRQQWEILDLLSSAGKGPGEGRLFLVGDFGQSIYRFRGAEVRIFSDVGREIREGGGEDLPLTRNFRSTKALISFVNYLQETMHAEMGPGDQHPGILRLEGYRDAETVGPSVEILVFKGDQGMDREACRTKEAGMLAGKIRDVVKAGSRDYGDVAVLFRSMTYVRIYEMALRRASIPYTLLKGGKFFGLPEVRDVIVALKAIEDAGDEIALAGLLRSPVFGVSDDTVTRLCSGSRILEGLSNWRHRDDITAEDGAALDRAADFLDEAREKKDTIGIYELISWILDSTNFQEVLQRTFAGERKVLNLNKLLQTALSFEAKGLFAPGDFIRYIDNVYVQEYHEGEAPIELEEAGVVKVMSVHSAKGLEFPVVFLPDVLWQRRSQQPVLVHNPAWGFAVRSAEKGDMRSLKYRAISFVNREEEMAESGRLLYVAATRARDRLVLSTGIAHSTSRENLSSSWLRWLWDLMPEEIRGEETTSRAAGDILGTVCEVTVVSGGETDDSEVAGGKADVALIKTESTPSRSEDMPSDIAKRAGPLERAGYPRELSVSGILDYRECPRLFYLRHVMSIPDAIRATHGDSPRSGTVSVGSLAHRVLEFWDLSTVEELSRVIETVVAGIKPGDRQNSGEEVRKMTGPFLESRILREMRDARDRGELFRELAFTVKICNVPVRGSIDAIYRGEGGDWIIVDYKAADAPSISSEGAYDRYRHQIMLYALAFGIVKGEYPGKGVIFFLPSGYQLETELSGLEEASEMVEEVIAGVVKGRYEGVDRGCHGCDMRGLCW